MAYTTAAKTDADSVIPGEYGGMWFLKGPLDSDAVGLTVLELEPDAKGKEHDHGPDGQEEIYYVVEGEVDVELDDGTERLGPEEAIRLDPEETRQLFNRGDEPATLVLVGGPLD